MNHHRQPVNYAALFETKGPRSWVHIRVTVHKVAYGEYPKRFVDVMWVLACYKFRQACILMQEMSKEKRWHRLTWYRRHLVL
jgi:hypothetical protein